MLFKRIDNSSYLSKSFGMIPESILSIFAIQFTNSYALDSSVKPYNAEISFQNGERKKSLSITSNIDAD